MTTQEPKPCKQPGCGVPITFRIIEGKPKPFNIDGSAHLHLKPAPAAKPDKTELKGEYKGITKGQLGIRRKDGILMILPTKTVLDYLTDPYSSVKTGMHVIATIEKDIVTQIVLDGDQPASIQPFQRASDIPKDLTHTEKTAKQILQENLDKKRSDNPAHFPDSSDLDARATSAKVPEEPAPTTVEPVKTPEERIREAMKMIVPSERVGYRISLAGCVNSVIEMRKIMGGTISDYPAFQDGIKKEAIELFLWMDFLTTQNIKENE